MFRVLLGVMLVAIAVQAKADGVAHIYSVGSNSCGTLLEAYEGTSADRGIRRNGENFYSEAHRYETWLAGYVSAANVASERPLKNVDTAGVTRWIRDYCEQNPSEPVVTAAAMFVKEHQQ